MSHINEISSSRVELQKSVEKQLAHDIAFVTTKCREALKRVEKGEYGKNTKEIQKMIGTLNKVKESNLVAKAFRELEACKRESLSPEYKLHKMVKHARAIREQKIKESKDIEGADLAKEMNERKFRATPFLIEHFLLKSASDAKPGKLEKLKSMVGRKKGEEPQRAATVTDLQVAIAAEDFGKIRLLLDEEPQLFEDKEQLQNTLYLSLRKKETKLLQIFAIKFEEFTRGWANSTLEEAAKHGWIDYCKRIISSVKVHPLMPSKGAKEAAATTHSNIVEYFLSEMEYTTKMDFEDIADHLTRDGDIDNLATLLSFELTENVDLGDALVQASKNNLPKAISMILEHPFSEIDATDTFIALKFVCEKGSQGSFDALVAAGKLDSLTDNEKSELEEIAKKNPNVDFSKRVEKQAEGAKAAGRKIIIAKEEGELTSVKGDKQVPFDPSRFQRVPTAQVNKLQKDILQ